MSTPSAGSYPLSRPTGVCAASGRPLVVGGRFVAVLVEAPDREDMQRQDFSIEAWEGGARPASPGRVFATWRSIMPEPAAAKKQLVMGDDELLDLFEQLSESTDQKKLAFRYVLALLLVRRKLLRYSGVRGRGPGSKMLVSRKPTAPGAEMPTLEVVDPGLDEETLSGAMQQIGELMGIETTTPGEPERSNASGAEAAAADPVVDVIEPKPAEPKPASGVSAGEGA
ncbi:MAG: hypothetical protein JNL50_05285 [Phycisphaerae bacterium]|nr:hypothetical protein [Phycisphaerae bacterium]